MRSRNDPAYSTSTGPETFVAPVAEEFANGPTSVPASTRAATVAERVRGRRDHNRLVVRSNEEIPDILLPPNHKQYLKTDESSNELDRVANRLLAAEQQGRL